MTWTVGTYLSYLLITIPLTVGVAAVLSRNGRVFLGDVLGDEQLAQAINRLLVVGFYLLNLGFVSLLLRIGDPVRDLGGLIETLSVKVGVVMLVVGVVHFTNVLVFNGIRRRHRQEQRSLPPSAPYYPHQPYPAPGR